MAYTIKHKVALITGGCSGIGFEVAKECLNKEAKGVILVDINEDVGTQKAKELVDQYGTARAIFVKGFVDDSASLSNAFKVAIEQYKQLDVVVNNAGVVDEYDWRKSVDVNLKGVIEGTNIAVNQYFPKYKSGKEAVLVNLCSIVYLNSGAELPVYTSTKYAIAGFTKSYAAEQNYDKYKTRFLVMCPGSTSTNIYATMRSKLSPEQNAAIKKSFKGIVTQTPDIVGKAICQMVETAKNGTFWSVEESKIYEIQFPEDTHKKVLVNCNH